MRSLATLTVSLALLACSQGARAADKDYNGRWDLIIHKTPANKTWWLEVDGAGSGGPITGMFTGAPGGLNPIENAKIEDGALHFSYDRPATPAQPAAPGGRGRGRGAAKACTSSTCSSTPTANWKDR